MAKKSSATAVEGVVSKYFTLVRALRNGDESSVGKLMELWHEDGVFEFAGTPPVTGTFSGAAAIQTLYKNRLQSSGMAVRVDSPKLKGREVSLGVVDTEVTHVRVNGKRVIAAWRTTVGTEEGHGFDVAGSHVFTFEEDKIKSLRITVSPKADESVVKELKRDDLSITDVGRLSLAAWAVV